MQVERSKLPLAALILVATVLPVCAGKKDNEEAEGRPGAGAKAPGGEIVALVDGEAVTRDSVDALIQSELLEIRREEYQARKNAVEQIVRRRLMQAEAERLGVEPDELFEREVRTKVSVPAPQDVDEFYEKYKNHRQFKGKSKEEATPDIRNVLLQQRLQQRQADYLDGLRAGADVRILLDPPRVAVDVPAGEPSRGPEDAPVTIVEFSDFECPYCKRAEEAVTQVVEEYADHVRFVYRDYPLGFHERALPAALAARCAGDQDKYWDYHRNLMTVNGSLDEEDLAKRAREVGLEMAAFNACMESRRHAETVQASMQDAAGLGVSGTPTFFINGRMLVGAQPYEAIKEVVVDELRRAGIDPAPGNAGG